MIISDTFVTRILRNISCALGKQSLYSRWKFISTFTELHGHGDERWPRTDVKYVFPLTNGSDVKYVLPRCPKLVKCPRKEDSLRREKEKKKPTAGPENRTYALLCSALHCGFRSNWSVTQSPRGRAYRSTESPDSWKRREGTESACSSSPCRHQPAPTGGTWPQTCPRSRSPSWTTERRSCGTGAWSRPADPGHAHELDHAWTCYGRTFPTTMTVVVVMDGSRGDSDGKYLMMTIMEILGDKVYIRGVDIGCILW